MHPPRLTRFIDSSYMYIYDTLQRSLEIEFAHDRSLVFPLGGPDIIYTNRYDKGGTEVGRMLCKCTVNDMELLSCANKHWRNRRICHIHFMYTDIVTGTPVEVLEQRNR